MSGFFRYPSTPHIAWLGTTDHREDKVLAEIDVDRLLAHEICVEEKLDGANLGISVTDGGEIRFQNRGQFLQPPFIGQFARLTGWAAQNGESLATSLAPGLMLFGEWLAARHSVKYNKLPDWFIAFDVFDTADSAFWSASRRDDLMRSAGITTPPRLFRGSSNLPHLRRLLLEAGSSFGDTNVEGFIIRRDNRHLNEMRAKLVRPDFVQSIDEHWRRRPLEWNRLG